jgi:hypothetical protein
VIDIEGEPMSGVHRLTAELEVTQGGGIPVRKLIDVVEIRKIGSHAVHFEWDGTDATGRHLPSDAFLGRLDLRLERVPGNEFVARVDAVKGGQLTSCTPDKLCIPLVSCVWAYEAPERCVPAFTESDHLCNLLGGFVPPDYTSWNFAGTDDSPPIGLPFAEDENDRYEPNVPPGGNPGNSQNPLVVGTDLGSPFEHVDASGKRELVFLFGDTKPLPELSYLHDQNGALYPSGTVFEERPSNDDTMAVSTQAAEDPPTGPDRCLDLAFFRGPDSIDPVQGISRSKLIEPVTVDGPLLADTTSQTLSGRDMGWLRVPGPGFSLGGQMFALVPKSNDPSTVGVACDPTRPCATGYECHAGACYSGDCSAVDGSRPCFKQNADATLATSPNADPKFRSLLPSEAAPGALDIYSERSDIIPLVAFHVPDESNLYAWGRSRIMGHPEAPAQLYFWKHGYSAASGLGAPEVFAGCEDDPLVCDAPKFSSDRSQALPVYDEDRLIVNQTSVTYLPNFGRWVMIYGGRLPWFLLWPRYPVLTEARGTDAYAGVYLRTAPHPWGPWSSAITIYNPYWSNVTGFCEIMYQTENQTQMLTDRVGESFVSESCDLESETQENPTTSPLDFASEYGTSIVPRFIQDGAEEATFYWLMSTWHPYRVVLMKTRIAKQAD